MKLLTNSWFQYHQDYKKHDKVRTEKGQPTKIKQYLIRKIPSMQFTYANKILHQTRNKLNLVLGEIFIIIWWMQEFIISQIHNLLQSAQQQAKLDSWDY